MSDKQQIISFPKVRNKFKQNLGEIIREFDCVTFSENSHLTELFLITEFNKNISSSPEICVPYYISAHIE